MTDHLKDLSAAGVSIWLDDLSRSRIESGNLAELIRDKQVVGVTTNPSIFSLPSRAVSTMQLKCANWPRRGLRPMTPSSSS